MGKIKIYTNESVDVAIAEGLRRRGVDAFSARDSDNLGLTDEEQLIYTGKEKARSSRMTRTFFKLQPDGWWKGGPILELFTVIRRLIRSAYAFGN